MVRRSPLRDNLRPSGDTRSGHSGRLHDGAPAGSQDGHRSPSRTLTRGSARSDRPFSKNRQSSTHAPNLARCSLRDPAVTVPVALLAAVAEHAEDHVLLSETVECFKERSHYLGAGDITFHQLP